FDGATAQGDEATEMKTLEDHPLWRLYDKASDTTTFCIDNPDEERNCLFILYDFPGKVEEFPGIDKAKRVRMTHQALGVTTTLDPASLKLDTILDKWNLAAALELPPSSTEYRERKGFGTPDWSLPPHVLLVDYQ